MPRRARHRCASSSVQTPRSWLRTAHADSSRDTRALRLVPDGAGCMMLIEVHDHAAGPEQVTVQAGAADRPSLASKIRGWKDDATGLEQRLKDLETISRTHRLRRVMVAFGFALGLVGWGFGAVKTRPTTMVLVAGGAAFVNEILGLIHERGWYRWWLVYALSLLDVILVAVLIVWFGNGGLIAAFFLAVLPHAFDQGHTVGNFLVLTAALAYLGASFLHDTLYEPSRSLRDAGLETLVFILVAMALKRIPATLIERIRHARSVMGEAERGYLAVRAPAGESDELGFLERSFNRMIEEIGGTISTVQREADEVAALAEELAASAEELHATSETVTHTAQRLATDLGQQREMAEGARGESAKAADQAEALRVRAELMQTDAGPGTGGAREPDAPRGGRGGPNHRRDGGRVVGNVGAHRGVRPDDRPHCAADAPARAQRRDRGGAGRGARRGLRGGRGRGAGARGGGGEIGARGGRAGLGSARGHRRRGARDAVG